MAFSDFQAKQKLNKQIAVVREYYTRYSGLALCLTDDQTFAALLSDTLKHLAVKGRLLINIAEPARCLKVISEAFDENKKPVLFIERVLNAVGDTSFLIRQFKDSYPELRIIVVTTVADKDRIMLMYEAGADSFVLKPLSSNDLYEKMAATVRPPSPFRQLLNKARALVSRNVGSEALTLTKKVLEIKPDSAAGYVVLGDALRLSADNAKAQWAYERACKYSGDYLEPLQRLADMARDAGNQEAQLEYLKRLDAISPLNTQRKVEIGELHVSLGNTEMAAQVFDTAVSRAYKDAMDQVAAMAQKIALSLQESDPVQAEKYLRQCLKMKGKDLSVDDLATFNQLGISLRKQGRWQDAVTEYKKALKIAPKAEGLYYNMGMAYAEGKDYETAIVCMQKALTINPNLPRGGATLAYNMGMVFAQGYTMEKARQCLEIALELAPDNERASKMLAKLRENGQTADAGGSGA